MQNKRSTTNIAIENRINDKQQKKQQRLNVVIQSCELRYSLHFLDVPSSSCLVTGPSLRIHQDTQISNHAKKTSPYPPLLAEIINKQLTQINVLLRYVLNSHVKQAQGRADMYLVFGNTPHNCENVVIRPLRPSLRHMIG